MKNIVIKWVEELRAEFPFFVRSLGCAMRLVRKLVAREDIASTRQDCIMLLEKSRRCQIVASVLLVLVAFLLMRGCGRSNSQDTGDGTNNTSVSSRGKCISRFDAEAMARKVQPFPLCAINLRFQAPAEGSVWENRSGTVKVIQTLEDGVLACFETFDDVITIKVGTSRQYADGEYLAEGYYVASGKYSYTTTKNARATVFAFEEVPSDVQRRIGELVRQREMVQAEKRRQLEQQRQKLEKEEKAKQDVHVPSTPDEVISEMFGLDFAKEGGELDFFEWLRGECPFVWNKFWNANEDELNKMDEDAWTRRKEVIRLFAKWLCDNKWTDARIGYKGYIDHFMSELRFGDPLENMVVQKSLRDKLIIECHPLAEKLHDMYLHRDWLGLMNVAYKQQHLVFDRLPEDWSVSARGIEKLAAMTVPMEIRTAEGATVQMNMLKVEKVMDGSDFKIDVVSHGDRANSMSLTEKQYIRMGGSEPDKALVALREGFNEKRAKIFREYKWKEDESDKKEMAKRINALQSEFVREYEGWLDAN